MTRKIPIWSWRHAIMKSKASAAARHLCHVIACDLSDTGKFTRLSVAELCEKTGMSERSISRHIADAEAAGLLRIERVHDAQGHVCGTRYYPQFPDDMTLATEPAEDLSANLADRGKPAAKAVRLSAKKDKPIGQIGGTDKETFPSTFPIKKTRAPATPAATDDDERRKRAVAAARLVSASLRKAPPPTDRQARLPYTAGNNRDLGITFKIKDLE